MQLQFLSRNRTSLTGKFQSVSTDEKDLPQAHWINSPGRAAGLLPSLHWREG
jgi:hypothetical protein